MEIYEGGNNLSLGEKQLIAFTRILAFNPPILILDEATASMDRAMEARLLHAMEETVENRTCIMIAHRLSTIESADQVLVLDEGKLAEKGSYNELLLQGGIFSKFHQIYAHA